MNYFRFLIKKYWRYEQIQGADANGDHRPSIGPVMNEVTETDDESDEEKVCTICRDGTCIEDESVFHSLNLFKSTIPT